MTAEHYGDRNMDTIIEPTRETTTFECPRCHTHATARFYGPCDTCRNQLRATLGGQARVIELEEYVPKMNVTPNAVALKDD